MQSKAPWNEATRLQALAGLEILDTPAEEDFDLVAQLASEIIGTPIALISLIDANRQWFKSKIGLDVAETPREHAFCAHAIQRHDVMVVPDATRDPRFLDNPLVVNDPSIRFYAGAPLFTEQGMPLGTLCIIDRVPREMTEAEQKTLVRLSRLVVRMMEWRAAALRVGRAEREARVAQTYLLDAIENVPDGFVIYDEQDRIAVCNHRFAWLTARTTPERITGIPYQELLALALAAGERLPVEFNGDTAAWLAARLERHQNKVETPILVEAPGGNWLQITEHPTRDGGIVGISTDVTTLKRSQQDAERIAYRDPLTGLPNRRLFEQRIAELCRSAGNRDSDHAAVMMVDLDDFKQVNDQFGHVAGDQLLRTVGERLRCVMREGDLVARYGGDEFVVLALGWQTKQEIEQLGKRVQEAVEQPVRLTTTDTVTPRCSIGVSLWPQNGHDLATLIEACDAAMYGVKRQGKADIAFFEP